MKDAQQEIIEEQNSRILQLLIECEKWKAIAEQKIAIRREIEAALGIETGDTNDEAKADDALNTRILTQHTEQIAELHEERRELEEQLTAHKAALEKCEKALSATWADLDHLNHWMPTPCRELYMEAKLEIAKLKGNK